LEHIGSIAVSLEPFVRQYGVFAVSLILTFESLGAPLPGETLLIFASVLAHHGEMSLPALLISAWAGSVFGRATITRYGGKVGLTEARINAVEKTFSRYGPATVVFARFFPILRQLNGIVAGALRMTWWRFLPFNAVGAALWVGTWVSIIYFSAHTVAAAHFANKVVFTAAAIGLIIVLISFVVRRLRHNGG
jgi:membrane protein DedA with SNARE-associated domain